MQRVPRITLFVFAGLMASLGSLWASTMAVETRLGRDVAYLNRLGRSTQGETSLALSLERRFRAESAWINEMRRARLGYGDISVALALASDLPGGATKSNVQRIMARWRGSRSDQWPKVARSLGLRLERVVLQIESMRARPVAQRRAAATDRPDMQPVAAADRPRSRSPVHQLVNGG
jgi:hypothetical protein